MKKERELYLLILFEIIIITIDMKMKQTLQGMIGVLMGASFLFSCSSEDVNSTHDEVGSHSLTSFITSSKEQSVKFEIKYDVPVGYKVIFDVAI